MRFTDVEGDAGHEGGRRVRNEEGEECGMVQVEEDDECEEEYEEDEEESYEDEESDFLKLRGLQSPAGKITTEGGRGGRGGEMEVGRSNNTA